jgi:signal transduction histidine kinase
MSSTTTYFKPLLAFLLTVSTGCFSQVSWPANSDWEALGLKHQTRRMHDTVYLASAQALTERSFKNPLLKDRLSKYRNIAWSNPAYQRFRIKYYAFLANHASAVHQDGYAIYYLQKMEEELKKVSPYTNSLNQPRQLLAIYSESGNYNFEKRIAIIDSVTPFLKALPAKLASGPVSINTCINAFTILKNASELYTSNRDTSKIFEFRSIARALWLQLKRKPVSDEGKLTQCQLSLYLIEANLAKSLGEGQKQADYLNSAYRIIASKDNAIAPLFKAPFSGTVLGRLIDYYIGKKQVDSASYFLRLYQVSVYKRNQVNNQDGTKILRYAAKVEAATGYYKPAYEHLIKSYAIKDSVNSISVADIHNNMYAHLVAEQRSEALLVQQASVARRNFVILSITTVLLLTVAAFLWLLRVNREKAERQIEKLNESTQIQIAELESHANEIRKEFGMELHDQVAGRLVNLVNYVELQLIAERNEQEKERLATILEMSRDAYSSTRSKSHEWFFRGSENDKILFSDRVRQIVGLALADGSYDKEIEIDDQCLEKIPVQTRIQMLRIIQGAVANILKHARARSVKLFIYEDEGAVILQIADNGRGFDVQNGSQRKGLGLVSMRQRAREINGSVNISSSEKGTEILLTIPSV